MCGNFATKTRYSELQKGFNFEVNFKINNFLSIKENQTTQVNEFSPFLLGSLMTQMIKNLPAMQETRVQSLGLEDPLEKGMVTHLSILICEIPRTTVGHD